MIVKYILENAIHYVLDVMVQVLLLVRCVYHIPVEMETEFVHVMTSGKGLSAKTMQETVTQGAMVALVQQTQIV